MSRSRYWTAAFLFLSVLAFPRTSSAGLWDVIIEMSGPKMYGITGEIRILPNGCLDSIGIGIATEAGKANGTDKCNRTGDRKRNRVLSALQTFAVKERADSPYWYSLSAGYYSSVPKTIDGHPYKYLDVQMITFEPMIEFQSRSSNVSYSNMRLQVYHGIGGGLNVLFVEGAPPTIARGVIKFRPAGVAVPFGHNWGFDVAYDLRLYPKGFTPSDFFEGAPPSSDGNSWEFVHAFAGAVRWRF